MKNSGTFIRSLIPADANNIVTLIDFNQVLAPYQEFTIENIVEHAIILEDLQCKVGLFSLLECDWPNTNALASESATEAERARIIKEGQKIYLGVYHAYGNGPWIKKGEEVLQNKNNLEQPWALMAPLFSTNETALLDEDLKIGARVEAKAQGSGGLKGSDYLHIFGSWRKTTNIRKKKDNGVEALQDRISALETLLSTFGAPSANLPGSNGLVPAPPAGSGEFLLRGDRGWENPNKFSTPAQITAAIDQVVGNSATALNTLAELGAALANDANFAATVTAQIALKAPKANPVFTGSATVSNGSGSIRFNPGSATTSGFLEIIKNDGINRIGYIGFDNVNMNYVSDNGTPHVFSGGSVRNTNTTQSTSTTTGASIISGGQAVAGNQYIGGFTSLGDNVAIKQKIVSGTTGSAGADASVSHGITGTIRNVACIVNDAFGRLMAPGMTLPGANNEYYVYTTSTLFVIYVPPTNSSNVSNRTFTALITYSS